MRIIINFYLVLIEPNDVTDRLVKRLSDQFFNVFVRILLYKLEKGRSTLSGYSHFVEHEKFFAIFRLAQFE